MEKKPFVTLKQLKEIEKTYPTPFYLYDEKGIRENAARLKQAFAWNKGYKEYFAVKATPNPFLLNLLKEMGCGTDCSSMTELMMSKACGFKGHDIMFSSNDTPPEEFAYAEKLGAIINLDDITHIECLEQTLGYIPETISCRFNPGGLFKISNDIMDNPGDSKYGMTAEQIGQAFKILKEKGAKNVFYYDVCRTDVAELVEAAFRYDKMVLAAASYDGGVFPPMENFLHHLKAKTYQNRKVALMENGSWGPTANKTMRGVLEGMKNVTICENTVTIRSVMNESTEAALEAMAEELCS